MSDQLLVLLCIWKMLRMWGFVAGGAALLCYAALRCRGVL